MIKNKPVKKLDLHTKCVGLGGCTLEKYTDVTGERTDHLLIEFLKRSVIYCNRYGKN